MEILDHIEKEAQDFLKFQETQEKMIAIFSHYDVDGLSSAAVLARTFKNLDIPFFIRIFDSLDKNIIKEIKEKSKNYACIFFLDLASSFIQNLENFDCEVYIIDHHEIEKEKWGKSKLHLINWRMFDDDYATSSSILTYFFSSSLAKAKNKNSEENENGKNEKIALLGLIGDSMDKELSKLSSLFLKIAREKGAIEIKRGLRFFSYSKPIHKAIEFGSVYIPKITGDSANVIEFLHNLGIDIKNGSGYRTLNDLNKDELSKLTTAVITSFSDEKSKSIDLVGNIYLIKLFDTVEDAKELATIINACGRLGKSFVILAFLLGKRKAREIAEQYYAKYKYEIFNGLKYVSRCIENKENVIKGENFIIINAKNVIRTSIIGVICSMLANSCLYEQGFVIVGLAHKQDKAKVSVRIVESENKLNAFNLLQKVKELSKLEFEVGGHERAAGALLKIEQEKEFLKYLEKVLQEESMTIKI
ncbi:MAG: DHH family phosphoesterase [Candidatus Pacearchaeota archaeon]